MKTIARIIIAVIFIIPYLIEHVIRKLVCYELYDVDPYWYEKYWTIRFPDYICSKLKL